MMSDRATVSDQRLNVAGLAADGYTAVTVAVLGSSSGSPDTVGLRRTRVAFAWSRPLCEGVSGDLRVAPANEELRRTGQAARQLKTWWLGGRYIPVSAQPNLRRPRMPVEPVPSEATLSALRTAVASLEARGRVTRVAGVKSELQRHLPDFNERQLGFQSFGAFVEAAAQVGAVRIERDNEGWTRVLSIGAPTIAGERPDRLRPDIWDAFTRWGEGQIRVWDRATARAIRLSAAPVPGEPAEHVALREAMQRADGQVIVISPIDNDEQQRWMQEFVAGLGEHTLARPLEAALSDPKPFRAFTTVLQADDALRRAFNRRRTVNVLAAVRQWAAENAVDLDALDHTAPPPSPAATPQAAPPQRDVGAILRAALHRAIDEMGVDELRRLSVPAGYIIDAQR
jgi:hypothetical protein